MAADDDKNKPDRLWQPANRILALALVEEMLLAGNGPRAILLECAKRNYTESLATVQGWCSEITATWEREAAEMAVHRRNLWRARLEARYKMMIHDLGDSFQAVDMDGNPRIDPKTGEPVTIPCFTGMARAKLYDSIAKLELLAFRLDGLDAPIVVKHEGVIDVRAMSPEQRRERIAELLAKRARLLPAQTSEGN